LLLELFVARNHVLVIQDSHGFTTTCIADLNLLKLCPELALANEATDQFIAQLYDFQPELFDVLRHRSGDVPRAERNVRNRIARRDNIISGIVHTLDGRYRKNPRRCPEIGAVCYTDNFLAVVSTLLWTYSRRQIRETGRGFVR
jgi:hypothetical protein